MEFMSFRSCFCTNLDDLSQQTHFILVSSGLVLCLCVYLIENLNKKRLLFICSYNKRSYFDIMLYCYLIKQVT